MDLIILSWLTYSHYCNIQWPYSGSIIRTFNLLCGAGQTNLSFWMHLCKYICIIKLYFYTWYEGKVKDERLWRRHPKFLQILWKRVGNRAANSMAFVNKVGGCMVHFKFLQVVKTSSSVLVLLYRNLFRCTKVKQNGSLVS
jgi:hypothetical protein